MSEQTLVAVYGTLRRGFGNNRLLENSVFLGEGVAKFWATMYSAGGFPILCLDDPDCKPSVELYRVSPEVLERLDRLEGYPEWYQRDLRTFVVGGEEIKAYIYHQRSANVRGNLTIISSGNWPEYIKSQRGAA